MEDDTIEGSVIIFLHRIYPIFLWLLSLSFAHGSWATESSPGILPSPGVYISAQYLQRLKTTRSPLLAEATRAVHAVLVQQVDSASVSIMANYNFHEGGPEFGINRAGAVSVIVSAGIDVSSVTLSIEASDRLTLGFDNHERDTFLKVEDFDRLLRAIVIAGRYVDGAGELFEFTEAGTVMTPQGSFPYEVGTDHIPYRFDYIVDPQRHLFFKLIRRDCVIDFHALPDWQDGHGPTDGSTAKLWQSLRAENCATDHRR